MSEAKVYINVWAKVTVVRNSATGKFEATNVEHPTVSDINERLNDSTVMWTDETTGAMVDRNTLKPYDVSSFVKGH